MYIKSKKILEIFDNQDGDIRIILGKHGYSEGEITDFINKNAKKIIGKVSKTVV